MTKRIIELNSYEEYEESLNSENIVIQFYANWCGPCLLIKKNLQDILEANNDIIFFKINVDNEWAENILEENEINCMPSFVFYKRGKIFDRFEGTNLKFVSDKAKALTNFMIEVAN